jgi:hypothetical protein
MNLYVDCTSGVSHLIAISNRRFNELGKCLKTSDEDELTKVIRMFDVCYYRGAVPSKCGRRVISAKLLISNINEAIELLDTELSHYELEKVLEAAFKGVYDNCASGDSDHYLPA